MKPLKILFFTDGPKASPEDYAEATMINGNVCFRNARMYSDDSALEQCDAVFGNPEIIPASYAAAFPDYVEAAEKRAKEIAALTSKVGDVAPKAPTKASGKTAPNWTPNATK